MRSYSAFVQYLVDRGNHPAWDGLTPAGEAAVEGQLVKLTPRCGVATLGFVGKNVVVYQIPAAAELLIVPVDEAAHSQQPPEFDL